MRDKSYYILLLFTLFFMCSFSAHAEKSMYDPDISKDYYYISQSSSAKAIIEYTKSYMYGLTEVCTCSHENVMKIIFFRHIITTKTLLDSCLMRTSHVSYEPSKTNLILSTRDSDNYYIYCIRHIII
jgi:hypothetical protein